MQTQLIGDKNQLMKITKWLYNVKREVTHKVMHSPWVDIQDAPLLGILTDDIESSQLDTIKSQVTGNYMILKNTKKKKKDYPEIGCVHITHIIHMTFYISYSYSQYFRFSW